MTPCEALACLRKACVAAEDGEARLGVVRLGARVVLLVRLGVLGPAEERDAEGPVGGGFAGMESCIGVVDLAGPVGALDGGRFTFAGAGEDSGPGVLKLRAARLSCFAAG